MLKLIRLSPDDIFNATPSPKSPLYSFLIVFLCTLLNREMSLATHHKGYSCQQFSPSKLLLWPGCHQISSGLSELSLGVLDHREDENRSVINTTDGTLFGTLWGLTIQVLSLTTWLSVKYWIRWNKNALSIRLNQENDTYIQFLDFYHGSCKWCHLTFSYI